MEYVLALALERDGSPQRREMEVNTSARHSLKRRRWKLILTLDIP